jgi:23S rRNA pseudouridine1911/1915/1917 synthase
VWSRGFSPASLVFRTITADRGDAGLRLDLVLRRHLTDVRGATRTQVQAWIERGLVTVNGRAVRRVASRTALGDLVEVALPLVPLPPPAPESVDVEVLFEDQHLLAVNKPPGLVVHPTHRHTAGTLLNALLWHARGWPAGQRPSIVGRLDKHTSGVVLVAKTPEMHRSLQRVMADRRSTKEYLAIVYGRVPRVAAPSTCASGATRSIAAASSRRRRWAPKA